MSNQETERNFEQRLNSTFKQVEPNPDFVRRLGQRLIWHPDTVVIEEIRPQSFKLLAGLFLLAVMVVVFWLVERTYRSKS